MRFEKNKKNLYQKPHKHWLINEHRVITSTLLSRAQLNLFRIVSREIKDLKLKISRSTNSISN